MPGLNQEENLGFVNGAVSLKKKIIYEYVFF